MPTSFVSRKEIRIAAIALALCAYRASAPQNATFSLTVDVEDQTGARIPGASFTATDRATGAQFESKAGATGQAVVHLVPGAYDLKAQARGFEVWEEKNVKLNAEQEWVFTLRVGSMGCPIVISGDSLIPLEHLQVMEEIPIEPLRQFVPPAKPLRHKRHWF
jgi:hypothetical protein